jgi:hypothetical protein
MIHAVDLVNWELRFGILKVELAFLFFWMGISLKKKEGHEKVF